VNVAEESTYSMQTQVATLGPNMNYGQQKQNTNITHVIKSIWQYNYRIVDYILHIDTSY
jgi:hypothetical protein